MKIDNMSIVKAKSEREAILKSISEWYRPEFATKYCDGIVMDDETSTVGTFVEVKVNKTYTSTVTSYFIATKMAASLVRVEHCIESSHESH